MNVRWWLGFLWLIGMVACQSPQESIAWKSIEKDLQARLILAQDGDIIELPEGHFLFTRSLSMDGKKNIILRGAGMHKTVLSFKGQEEGAEGVRITHGENIVLEDFTIMDSAGDNIKVSDTRGITFRRIASTWSGGALTTNGAYGLYPVLCSQVLIEYCEASNASDAGIYVGQSDSVIIRHNKAFQNVAGIESENSRWVEIYENNAYHNTGGILIFDLPGLTQTGHSTRVYANKIEKNNHTNFAPKGNTVANVPPGTGIMVLATRYLEIWDNDIVDNRTSGTAIISYELVAAMSEGSEEEESNAGAARVINNNFRLDTTYDPFVDHIYIHHNRYKNRKWFATSENDIGKLLTLKFFMGIPDIAFDGIMPEKRGLSLCIKDNGKAKFVNLDAAHSFENLSTDLGPFACEGQQVLFGPIW
jgi:parallel beta-helix repeat protein